MRWRAALRKGVSVLAGGVASNALYALLLAALCSWLNYPTSTPQLTIKLVRQSISVVVQPPRKPITRSEPPGVPAPATPVISLDKNSISSPEIQPSVPPRAAEPSLPQRVAIEHPNLSPSPVAVQLPAARQPAEPSARLMEIRNDPVITIVRTVPIQKNSGPISASLPSYAPAAELVATVESETSCGDSICILFTLTNVGTSTSIISELQLSSPQTGLSSSLSRDVRSIDKVIDVAGEELATISRANFKIVPPVVVNVATSEKLTLRIANAAVLSPSYLSNVTFILLLASGNVVAAEPAQLFTP